MDSYHKFFMYEDGSIYPVLYDESCIMRRTMWLFSRGGAEGLHVTYAKR